MNDPNLMPGGDIVARIAAYEAGDGRHDDNVGADLYELAEEAAEEVKRLRKRAIPEKLTPALRDCLGIMCFQLGPIASKLRHAKAMDIPCKAEDEQAYLFHLLVPIALEFGKDWRIEADKKIAALVIAACKHERTSGNPDGSATCLNCGGLLPECLDDDGSKFEGRPGAQ